jgi:hypothetical protein
VGALLFADHGLTLDYDDYQIASAPSWLGGENGTLWSRVQGIVKDAIAAAVRAAVMQRFAQFATPSSLSFLLEDRGLDPAWRENETSVRARVKAAWDTWAKNETVIGMEQALALAGYTDYAVIDQALDGDLRWWEFYIVVRPPFPWTDTYLSDGLWGDAGLWNDGGSWAADAPPEELSRLRLIARKKPTHATCRYIVIIHAGAEWDADAPPGEWDDDATATWGDEVSYVSPL